MSGHETKMSHIDLERQQAGRQNNDNEVVASCNHVSKSFVQERLDDILDQLSAIMTEHPNQEGEEKARKSHVDKKVVAAVIYNRKNLGRESPPLPSSPRLEDKYVAMHGQVSCAGGRRFNSPLDHMILGIISSTVISFFYKYDGILGSFS